MRGWRKGVGGIAGPPDGNHEARQIISRTAYMLEAPWRLRNHARQSALTGELNGVAPLATQSRLTEVRRIGSGYFEKFLVNGRHRGRSLTRRSALLASLLEAAALQSSPGLDEGDNAVQPLACLHVGQNERSLAAHPASIELHLFQGRADMGREVNLVDD